MREKWKQTGQTILYELVGCLLVAVGTNNFAIAAQLPLFGFSGIAFILNTLCAIPVGRAIILLNIPVAILCYKLLGRRFFIRSIRCMLISSLMMDYLAPLFPLYHGDRLLAALATGVVAGVGYALIYLNNSSTGGMDFVSLSIKVFQPHLPLGKINLGVDLLVIAAGSALFRDIDGFIYGLIVSFLLSVVVDKAIFGFNAGKLALIITENGDRICQVIEDTCHRGSTILPGRGGYLRAEKQIVISACSTKQMVPLKRAVEQADPNAFTVILESSEVQGSGFDVLQFGERKTKELVK